MTSKYHINTRIVKVSHEDGNKASIPPIYQSTTFKADSIDSFSTEKYDYTRSGNPTRSTLQEHLQSIINCKHVFTVNSGMACLDVILSAHLKPNDEVIAGEDLYGGSDRLLHFFEKKSNIIIKHYDTTDLNLMKNVITSKTKLVLIESPTNPLINVVNVREISNHAHKVNPDCIVVFDNTMMTPLLMSPLELGCDIHYESATKYLNGHHDIMAGVLATNNDSIAKKLFFVINATGSGLAPFDSWLLIRGLKTLSIRLEREQENCIKLANHLLNKGFKVRYTGLKNHPQYDLHFSQCKGPGAVLSFETGNIKLSEAIIKHAKIFSTTVSFGSVSSLISLPLKMSHSSIDQAVLAERQFPQDLIRLCVGIEDIRDLIDDLDHAIAAAKRDIGAKL
jgi:cystathionine beta-lyase